MHACEVFSQTPAFEVCDRTRLPQGICIQVGALSIVAARMALARSTLKLSNSKAPAQVVVEWSSKDGIDLRTGASWRLELCSPEEGCSATGLFRLVLG